MNVDKETGRLILDDAERALRLERIAQLRLLADFHESCPDLPVPYLSDVILIAQDAAQMAALIKAVGKKMDKMEDYHEGDTYMRFRYRVPGTRINVRIIIEKEKTCERVLKEVKIIPAVEEHVVPAQPERREEVYEWRCPKSILELAAYERLRGQDD